MNCDLLHRRLLNLERPDRPPAEVQAHLAGCPSCREWQRRLVRLEQRVALLPVPASTAKGAFVARLRAGQRATATRQSNGAGNRGQRHERAVKKLALATALAAALMLFALGWWALQWSPPEHATPGDLLAELVHHDVDLAKAETPLARRNALEGMANDLRRQAKPLSRPEYAEDLKELARWYGNVLDTLPQQTQGMTEADRKDLQKRLEQAGRDTQQLSSKAPAACAGSLLNMASAAQDAARRLGALEAHAPQLPRARVSLPGARQPALCAGIPPAMAAYLVPAAVPWTLLAPAAPTASPDSTAEQAGRFHQNRVLIGKLVDGGVYLAGLPGPKNALERAAKCNEIAQQLAAEMKLAADQHQGARVVNLGEHLESLLEGGVASNLSTAHGQVKSGGFSEKDLQDVRQVTAEFLDTLKGQLEEVQDQAEAEHVKAALGAIAKGRERVEKALQDARP